MTAAYVAQLAYLLTFASYAVRNIVWLRSGAILAGGVAIYYSLTAGSEPMWVPILWNALFIAVNGIHLALARWRTRNVKLNALDDFLAKTVFSNFPPAEVRSFSAFASEGELPAGAQVIRANTEINNLYCIVQGQVRVEVHGRTVASLGPGQFLGEMSLLTRSPTRADVMVEKDLKVLVWPHEGIDQWVNSDASRLGLLQSALGMQVIEALLRAQGEVSEEPA